MAKFEGILHDTSPFWRLKVRQHRPIDASQNAKSMPRFRKVWPLAISET
jgi:hypothetical protein